MKNPTDYINEVDKDEIKDILSTLFYNTLKNPKTELFSFPKIRRVFGNLIATDIVSVQF
jgi:hypothetical protein